VQVEYFDETSWLSTAYLSLCQDGIRGWNQFAFMWIVFTLYSFFRSCEAGTIVYGKWCFDLHVQCCGSCMVSTEFSAYQYTCVIASTAAFRCLQARNQLRRRVFWERPKVFKPCPIFLNYVQHIFPGEAKKILGVASPPLVTGLGVSSK